MSKTDDVVSLPPLTEISKRLVQENNRVQQLLTDNGGCAPSPGLHFFAAQLKGAAEYTGLACDYIIARAALTGIGAPTSDEITTANARLTFLLRLADYPSEMVDKIQWALINKADRVFFDGSEQPMRANHVRTSSSRNQPKPSQSILNGPRHKLMTLSDIR